MIKKEFFIQYRSIVLLNNWILLGKICIFLSLIFLISCGKQKNYPDYQTFNSRVDTATLIVKITNTNNLPVDIAKQKSILLLFSADRLFYQQIEFSGITTPDTSITFHGIAMGHYTALLIMDAPGTIHLNYLKKGIQSYQNVIDTLTQLVTDTYTATDKNMIVADKINKKSINLQPMSSLISEVSFDLSQLLNTTIWKNPSSHYNLNLLVFQNGILVLNRPIVSTDIQNGIYQTPIVKDVDYSFLITDLNNNETSFLENGTTTIANVQQKLETQIDDIRMAIVEMVDLENNTHSISPQNAIKNIPVILSTNVANDDWTAPNTICSGFNLLVFDANNILTRILPTVQVKDNPSSNLSVNVFDGATYILMAVGNAEVGINTLKYKALTTTINTNYVTTNFQKLETIEHSFWLAQGNSQIISNFPTYPLAPVKITSLNSVVLATIDKLRAGKDKPDDYFIKNPMRISAIVTANGEGENDIPNTIIVQDATGAIPIQFVDGLPSLQIGDHIDFLVQEGNITQVDNIYVLQNLHYKEISKTSGDPITPKYIPITDINPTNYNKYEAMLIKIFTPLEFRWFKGWQYYSDVPTTDSLELRDASPNIVNTLPSDRRKIKIFLLPTALSNSSLMGSVQFPISPFTYITGFLMRTKNGDTAIMPRNEDDIITTGANKMTTRVDGGIVAQWTSATPIGVGREGAMLFASPQPFNQLVIRLPVNATPIGQIITIMFNTLNVRKGENIQFSLNGNRSAKSGLGGTNGTPILFDVEYSTGSGFEVLKNGATPVTLTISSGSNFSIPNVIIPSLGGYDNITIRLTYTGNGKTGTAALNGSLDNVLTFTNITATQF